jgi:hypothetical protein
LSVLPGFDWNDPRLGSEGKDFFFEQKKPETLIRHPVPAAKGLTDKSFLVLFLEKGLLALLAHGVDVAGANGPRRWANR